MSDRWIILSISGISCGGKTTLADKLQKSLPNCVIIRQDLYFHPEDSPLHVRIPELNHFNHDTIEAIDVDAMLKDVQLILNNYIYVPKASVKIQHNEDDWKVLIVEGFITLNYEPLRKISDLKYQINLTREEFFRRRLMRKYSRPEVPGYLETCVWPEYLKHNEQLLNYSDIIFLDGEQTMDSLFARVLADIKLKIQEKENKIDECIRLDR